MASTFIVAELSANHGHSLSIALETVRAARASGADAIKLQTYTPDTITLNCDNEYFRIQQGTIWDGETLYTLYQKAYTPWEWHKAIQKEAEKEGLIFFSTPFDRSAVDFLSGLDVPMYKIASFEINDIPLITYAAAKGKPMILSTGVATCGEIDEAVQACRKTGNNHITVLKCTSEYPAKPEDANLRTMVNFRETFGVDVGLSDHTEGFAVAVAAVALGATMVEKHFILDRSIGGPDSSFSMEPKDFKMMTDSIRTVEKALGRISYELPDSKKSSRHFMRSLFAVEDIQEGEVLSTMNVRSIRPGVGIPPKYLDRILGAKARRTIQRGTPLSFSDLDIPGIQQ